MVISDFLYISTPYTDIAVDTARKPYGFIHLPADLLTYLPIHPANFLPNYLHKYPPTNLPI
jgi:hypothetical protein